MESKDHALILIALISGLVGGYLVGSVSLQNQIQVLQLRLDEEDEQIVDLQSEISSLRTSIEERDAQIAELEETVSGLQTSIQEKDVQIAELQRTISLLQSRTQVRIDAVEWNMDRDSLSLSVRNTGSVDATIESISMRLNVGGSKWYMDKTDDATGAISVGGTREFVWDETSSGAPSGFLAYGKSYIIRVTTTTGFYYEIVASSPPPP